MRRLLYIQFLLGFVTLVVPVMAVGDDAGGGSASALNVNAAGLALSGYDPVSYFASEGPVLGKATFSLEFRDGRYQFATEANLERFRAAPEKYEPAFGGWCAWAMLEGERVQVDPLTFRIHEGELLLFYNGFWGNTLKRWIEKTAKVPEAALFAEAQDQWRAMLAGATPGS